MSLMKNKWFVLAILWFSAAIWGLIFREALPNHAPMFPHFDKLAHCLLFFGQFWLLARAFLAAKKPVPYAVLWCFALVMAMGTEWAQAAFTHSRQADVWDCVADMLGATIALMLAHHAHKIWTRQATEIKAE